jgi:phosphate transport system substrate-binding protein
MRLRSIFRRSFFLLVLGALLAQCAPAEDARRDSVIRIDGSSTVYPISEALAEEFQRERRNVRITVGISGSGGGFQKFCRGETDISNASRPIAAVEIERCRSAGIEFIELPIAYDGLAVVVNPGNTWVDKLTVSELKRMWEPAAERRITRWSQIRPGWPDRELRLFGPGVDSGTFDYFTEAVVGKEKASRGDFTSSEDDNVLVTGVATDELALGYFGLAYYEENRDRLRLIPIENDRDEGRPDPVRPTVESVRSGEYRPLSRPMFVYVSNESLNRSEVRDLLVYAFGHGAELVQEVGYVPLPEREYELARARLDSRTTGTMFGEGTRGMRLAELLSGDSR